jgi:RHS repeat-associated protein
VQYNYFADGSLKSVTTNNGATLIAEYSSSPTQARVDYGNGTYAVCEFGSDSLYTLNSISHYREDSPDVLLMTIDYADRDKTGNPETISDTIGDWTYTYDSSGRLASAVPPTGPIPEQPFGGDFDYDWVGNRLSPPVEPNQMVLNKVDQLLEWKGRYVYSYYYDGSLKDVKTPDGVLVASYTYHPDGSLDTIIYPGGTITNTWDTIGNRVGITVNEAAYSFIYDPTADIPAVLEENRPGGVVVRYYRTPDGALIARKKGVEWRYYHYDELGSTRLLTDSSGNVIDQYCYDAWGNVTSHIGSTTDNPYQYVGALGYYTHWQCPDAKLLQLGFRFYNPEIGRFTQIDPIGDELSWYTYCGGNPLAYVDPWGLSRRKNNSNRRGQDFESDIFGRQILSHWLYGGGKTLTFDNDPAWSTYMKNNKMMGKTVGNYLKQQATGMKNGEVKAFKHRIHMEMENGEAMTGYNYLHGTNKNVGDFLISGYISKHKDGKVAFVMTYQWNDKIDPNFQYSSDRQKSRLARLIPFAHPKNYNIHISWTDRSVMNSKGQYIDGWLSPCGE